MKASQIMNECVSGSVLDMDKVRAKTQNKKELIEEVVELAQSQGITAESKGRKRQMLRG